MDKIKAERDKNKSVLASLDVSYVQIKKPPNFNFETNHRYATSR